MPIAVAAANFHSIFLRSDGEVIFDGWHDRFNVPPLPEGKHYVAVCAGHDQSILLRNDGKAVGIGTPSWVMQEISELQDRIGVRYIPYEL